MTDILRVPLPDCDHQGDAKRPNGAPLGVQLGNAAYLLRQPPDHAQSVPLASRLFVETGAAITYDDDCPIRFLRPL
jgi:hypothetical protein